MTPARAGALEADIVAAGKLAPSQAQVRAAEFGLEAQAAAPGSHYMVLRVASGKRPTTAQRVVMAKHASHLGSNHGGRYAAVRTVSQPAVPTQPEGQEMTKKGTGALPAGIDVKEIEAAHAQSVKEAEEREAAKAKEAEAKAKAEAKTVADRAKAAKKLKAGTAKRRAEEVKSAPKEETKKPVGSKAAAGDVPKRKIEAPKVDNKTKGGRPAKVEDPNQKYRVLKDNTRSGHMKTFMAKAAELKTFTRAALIAATKGKVTEARAERYFDYCLYKRLIGEAR